MKKRLGQNTLFSFLAFATKKRNRATARFRFFLMPIGEVVFIRMSQPLFILICLVNMLVLLILYLCDHAATYTAQV